jgi:ActR/RegA family two-component response regulator
MIRMLLVGQDPATAQRLALECLARDFAIVIAENVCEAVRVLATTPVSLIVADLPRLRLGFQEQASLFDRVAPGVRVLVTVPSGTALETRVALELAGFQVVPSPVTADEILKQLDGV